MFKFILTFFLVINIKRAAWKHAFEIRRCDFQSRSSDDFGNWLELVAGIAHFVKRLWKQQRLYLCDDCAVALAYNDNVAVPQCAIKQYDVHRWTKASFLAEFQHDALCWSLMALKLLCQVLLRQSNQHS